MIPTPDSAALELPPPAGPPVALPPPAQARPTVFLPEHGRVASNLAGSTANAQPPPLPRRKRQATFPSPAERMPASPPAAAPPPESPWPSAEQARDRMSAFQRGTQQGRSTDPPQ